MAAGSGVVKPFRAGGASPEVLGGIMLRTLHLRSKRTFLIYWRIGAGPVPVQELLPGMDLDQ